MDLIIRTLDNILLATSDLVGLLINLIAVVFIAVATVALVGDLVKLLLQARKQKTRPATGDVRRIWLDYARWLVAALTLQLGADIIESAITPSWQAIGQLAAIAAVRTFLNYFLERDISEVRELDR